MALSNLDFKCALVFIALIIGVSRLFISSGDVVDVPLGQGAIEGGIESAAILRRTTSQGNS